MIVYKWMAEYTNLQDQVVGEEPAEGHFESKEKAEDEAPRFLEKHSGKGAILWRVRRVRIDV